MANNLMQLQTQAESSEFFQFDISKQLKCYIFHSFGKCSACKTINEVSILFQNVSIANRSQSHARKKAGTIADRSASAGSGVQGKQNLESVNNFCRHERKLFDVANNENANVRCNLKKMHLIRMYLRARDHRLRLHRAEQLPIQL